MKKTRFKGIGLFVLILFLLGTLSCDSGSSSDENDESGIPQEAVETAEGIFYMIDEFMIVGATQEGYPEGVQVNTEKSGKVTMFLTNFEVDEDAFVTGKIGLAQTSENPLVLEITAELVATGDTTAVVKMNIKVTWAPDENPPDYEPESFTGTFAFNGATYQISSIMAAMAETDDDDEYSDDPEDTLEYDEVLETTEEIFYLVGMMINDSEEYHSGTFVITTETTTAMTLVNYAQETGLFLSGTITIAETTTTPPTIHVSATLTLSGELEAAVTMNGNVTWQSGEPGVDTPTSIDGILSVNSTEYGLADLFNDLYY